MIVTGTDEGARGNAGVWLKGVFYAIMGGLAAEITKSFVSRLIVMDTLEKDATVGNPPLPDWPSAPRQEAEQPTHHLLELNMTPGTRWGKAFSQSLATRSARHRATRSPRRLACMASFQGARGGFNGVREGGLREEGGDFSIRMGRSKTASQRSRVHQRPTKLREQLPKPREKRSE